MATFVCCTSLILGVVGLFLIFRVANNIAKNSPEVTDTIKQDFKRLLPDMFFWMPLGGIFGAVGVILLMELVGIPLNEATGWIVLGVIAGGLWGLIWSIVYGLTERRP